MEQKWLANQQIFPLNSTDLQRIVSNLQHVFCRPMKFLEILQKCRKLEALNKNTSFMDFQDTLKSHVIYKFCCKPEFAQINCIPDTRTGQQLDTQTGGQEYSFNTYTHANTKSKEVILC